MNKEEVFRLFEELGDSKIDDLYYYSCLIASGFDEDTAYENINLLENLFLKDENNTSISALSDMLYSAYDEINIDDMSGREILEFIYNYSYGNDNDVFF